MFDVKLPISQIDVTWKPLSYGSILDIKSAHKSENTKHLLEPALIVARVVKWGDKPQCAVSDLRALDALDVECLMEDIQIKETERDMTLRKKESGASYLRQAETSAYEMEACLNAFVASVKNTLDNLRIAEAKATLPLK